MRAAVAFTWVLSFAAVAVAQRGAREQELRGFTTAEFARLEPLLADGVVGLVDLQDGDTIPAVHLVADVRAPARTVAELLSRPEDYPSFLPAIGAVTIRERHAGVTAYAWQWQTSVFSLGGEATVTLLSPQRGDEARGYRVIFTRTGGDLGEGRAVWRIVPRATGCTVSLSARMDLRGANAVTRQLQGAARSLSRSITLSLAYAELTRTRREAERRSGYTRTFRSVEQPIARPAFDVVRLEPVLARGDLIYLESDGTSLRQASIAVRLPHPEEQVRAIMLDPIAFTQALINGSQASVRERNDDGTHFDWRVDLPFVGTSGAMRVREGADRIVELDALDGAMSGGRWRFETTPRVDGTVVIGWARFEVADANVVLRAIVDADASFRPGLSAATEVMMARALRNRLTP